MDMISPIIGKRFLQHVAAAILALAAVSCGGRKAVPEFNADRAFQLLVMQTDLGPRVPGSAAWQQFQSLARRFFDSLGVDYETQPFTYPDYLRGDTIDLVNWIVHINPGKSNRILLGAHYDSRPRADYDPDTTLRSEPIPGANDGASGTAVLMHLCELMAASPPDAGVDLIFFDGEDYGPPGRSDQYLLGSTYYASHHKGDYDFGIIIDMIGDSDLDIYREVFSDRYVKNINDLVWNTAAKLGIPAFIDSLKYEVIDDHLPLISGGIPTIDVIDFDYPYWHTHADTPDKCSPASLAAVGRVLLDVVYER
jgi:glutaminyl-peptide cyclotransferase